MTAWLPAERPPAEMHSRQQLRKLDVQQTAPQTAEDDGGRQLPTRRTQLGRRLQALHAARLSTFQDAEPLSGKYGSGGSQKYVPANGAVGGQAEATAAAAAAAAQTATAAPAAAATATAAVAKARRFGSRRGRHMHGHGSSLSRSCSRRRSRDDSRRAGRRHRYNGFSGSRSRRHGHRTRSHSRSDRHNYSRKHRRGGHAERKH